MARLLRKARAEKEGPPGKRFVPHLSSCVAECGEHNQRKAGGLEALQSSLEAAKSKLEAPKSRPGGSKIEAWTLQIRAPGPPKSSPEASKTPFLKNLGLKKVKRGMFKIFLRL